MDGREREEMRGKTDRERRKDSKNNRPCLWFWTSRVYMLKGQHLTEENGTVLYYQHSKHSSLLIPKSRRVFALAMVILIVGLTLDFDYQNNAIANTLTIISFAVIFFAMGYKEQYATRIEQLSGSMYKTDQMIIDKLREQINTLRQI